MNVRSFMKKKDLSAAVKSLQKRFAWICGFYTVCLESSNSTFFFSKKNLTTLGDVDDKITAATSSYHPRYR